MTAEIIDMSEHFSRKKWLNSRHEQCWQLHEKYADRFQKYGLKHDLQFAQQWMDKAMGFSWEIDLIEGKSKSCHG